MITIEKNLVDNFIFLKDSDFFYYTEFKAYFNINSYLFQYLVLDFESYYSSILKNTIEL